MIQALSASVLSVIDPFRYGKDEDNILIAAARNNRLKALQELVFVKQELRG